MRVDQGRGGRPDRAHRVRVYFVWRAVSGGAGGVRVNGGCKRTAVCVCVRAWACVRACMSGVVPTSTTGDGEDGVVA